MLQSKKTTTGAGDAIKLNTAAGPRRFEAKSPALSSLIGGLAIFMSALVHAPAAAKAGDPAYGEYLAGECVTCHRTDGKDSNIPDITGWPAEAFVAVLQSYKTKERENRVMQTIAAGLGDDEMAALAAYFASLKANN